MTINKAISVYFSPTGTTRIIVEEIIHQLQVAVIEHIDLTTPTAKTTEFVINQDAFAVIGAPVYSGRIPSIAIRRLKKLKADKTPAVIVVVYGNRAYEDALLELSNLVKEVGFIPIAAAAFIGEHSYSTMAIPIAKGRPDPEDLIQARDFGAKVRIKIGEIKSLDTITTLPLPGNFPYQDIQVFPEVSPVTLDNLCDLCGACVTVCPTAAITINTTVLTDKTQCIRCCACVKSCPIEARVMEDARITKVAQWLSSNCQERKAPEFFI
jgi:ferredoxin